jgi:hypothetical protein
LDSAILRAIITRFARWITWDLIIARDVDWADRSDSYSGLISDHQSWHILWVFRHFSSWFTG